MRKLLLALFILPACGILDFNYADYSTRHGVAVFHGVDNVPAKGDVERWTDETLDFWAALYPEATSCMYVNTSRVLAIFHDAPHVFLSCEAVAGTQRKYKINISNGPYFKIRGVYIHELSHVLVEYCLGLGGNDESHMLFDEVDFCSLAKYC